MSKPTKKQQLDAIMADARNGREHLYIFEAEFIPRKGWYAIPDESRWYGDGGDFLGKDFKSAIAAAKNIYS
jgi:hypothetical protein